MSEGYEIEGFRKTCELFATDYKRALALCFVLGFVVRLIPEVLSYPYPIGFDTVYYAARIKSGVVWDHWSSIFSSWLLYALLISTYRIVHIDPFLLLKLTAPVLYALNVCGIYYFAERGLKWKAKKALVAAFFFAFQLGALRISWDLYRNTLGLAILLFALPSICKAETKRDFVLSTLLSLLVVFVHELVSVVLFTVVSGMLVSDFLKGERVRCRNVFVSLFPALVAFLIIISSFPIRVDPLEMNVIRLYDPSRHSVGLFFFVNYLGIYAWQHPAYLYLISHVLGLFGVLYLLWLPLVLVGFFRDKILDGWTFSLLFWSFNALITPFCALGLWHRSMFMLVYPFTFFAVNGMEKVLDSQRGFVCPNFRWIRWIRVSKKVMYGILLLSVLLGLLFISFRHNDYGFFSVPITNPPLQVYYFPSTMLQNTVPLQDAKSTVEAIEWLNNNMINSSCVLAHLAFMPWAQLHLDRGHVMIYFLKDIEGALNIASKYGFDVIYLIWWNENIGLYDLTIPESFTPVFRSERISIFQWL